MINTLQLRAIALLFIFAISTPGLAWLFGETQNTSEQEKRRLASAPEINFDKRLLTQFPADFDQYFSDHYGLRSELITLRQSWKSAAFGKSSLKKVIEGEQDWLFYDWKESLKDHIGESTLNQQQLNSWQQHLVDKKKWLSNLGIKYLFVPALNKMSLFPEHLPKRIRDHSGETMLDQLFTKLESDKVFDNYLELEPMLMERKLTGPEMLQSKLDNDIKADSLYLREDTHWSSLGAFLSYQSIMLKLQTLLPTLEAALQFDEVKPKRIDKKGDLAGMLSISIPEQHHRLIPIEQCAPQEYELLRSFKKTHAYKLQKRKLPKKAGCATKSLRAVIMHDSFGKEIQPFFAESFKEVIFIENYNFVALEGFLRDVKPDVFIDIRVERNIKYLLSRNKLLNKAISTLNQASSD
ncbi:MAG: alginate O-acetyltransferase complex protein AlgJ [Saprospiraceae bacterium]|jgi:alginate O-acetyltransferase complex protein AlgJ